MNIPDEVDRFREVATDYCAWAESSGGPEGEEAATALRLLASLLHHVQSLPGAEPENLPEHDIVQKGEGTVAIYRRFGKLPFQYYAEVFDPLEVSGSEPVTGDLADDLMDIYCDLKQGVQYLDDGHPVQAVFHWSFTYAVHWGRHATSALRALHCYLVDPKRV
jgi:hypothetical protein